MTHRGVPCQRDGCGNEFTVEHGQESARCPSCGKEHTPPWDQYDDNASGSGADVHVEGDGVQVTITIDVQPVGSGAN